MGNLCRCASPSLSQALVDADARAPSFLQLPQSALETVLPRDEGAAIMVVSGKLRGSKGRLLKRHAAEGVAAVQLALDFSVHRLMLDDVAAYMGVVEEEE